jgi:lipid-binding SYLF domain-containing protein
MKSFLLLAAVAMAGAMGALAGCSASGATPDEKRDNIRTMADDALKRLYREEPGSKAQIEQAAGYGVFSNIGTNVIFVSTGGGYGMVHNNRTGDDTYMKMGEFGVGLGLGLKDFRAVFVFHDLTTLNTFVESGWEFGGEADAAAAAGDKGGSASGAATVASGMTIYQFTENGLALSATVSGTKYWKDDSLN